ncbi:MAG: CoA transferase, partial [Dehalococcoidia bacterium]|nr:CoA transferase [Dehalococcoidia bacterium]
MLDHAVRPDRPAGALARHGADCRSGRWTAHALRRPRSRAAEDGRLPGTRTGRAARVLLARTTLFAAKRDGAGDHLDISMQEAQAASLEAAGPNAMVRGIDSERAGNQARAVWGIYPCADGYVGVAAMARQTGSVYQCIEHPELLESPVLMDLTSNPEGNEVASALITEWTMAHSAQEIFDISHRHRAPFSLIATPAQLLEWEPLLKRGFWKTLDHPELGQHLVPDLPFSLDGERGAFERAPLLGEHTEEVLR